MKKTDIFSVFDIETDGLLHEVTKIHCLSYQNYQNGKLGTMRSLTSYTDMIAYFDNDYVYVGHNIIRYDIPVLEKIIGINMHLKVIDTLGLSWYMYPKRLKPGLESWGEEIGVLKVEVNDWKNLTKKDYIKRCETDVHINMIIFKSMMNYLLNLYTSFDKILPILDYITFNLENLKNQESHGIKLDVHLCEKHLQNLEKLLLDKLNILCSIMPSSQGKILKSKPKKCYKQDSTLSSAGYNWYKYLEENNLPQDTLEVRDVPNPGSDTQLKEWLFSLGWKPVTFKVSKITEKTIPQVSLPFGGGICPSIKELYIVEPQLIELEGFYKIKHRIGVFKSYLDNEKHGYVTATANGFTSTLRLTHSKPIVNLPKPSVFYGKEIREVLITEPHEIMCGSDVSSLEDSTKQHYIYDYDPDYVNNMRIPGFDPHIDIAVLAGLMTIEEEEVFKKIESMSEDEKNNLSESEIESYKKLKKIRGTAKTVNFACVYGAGAGKIAETAKIDVVEAIKLHSIYWDRNKSVKQVAENVIVKTVRGQKWLYNPVSKFWMFLKSDKDKFSALNQSTGNYVFNTWLKHFKTLAPETPVVMQLHDEVVIVCKEDLKDFVTESLKLAMKLANEELKLNVEIGISIDWGKNYSEVH